jgi:hypothetical protein
MGRVVLSVAAILGLWMLERGRGERTGFVGFHPKFFLLHQDFSVLIQGGHGCWLEEVTSKGNIHSRINLNQLAVGILKSSCTGFEDLGLKIGKYAFTGSNSGNFVSEFAIFADSLCHAWSKSILKTSDPLDK